MPTHPTLIAFFAAAAVLLFFAAAAAFVRRARRRRVLLPERPDRSRLTTSELVTRQFEDLERERRLAVEASERHARMHAAEVEQLSRALTAAEEGNRRFAEIVSGRPRQRRMQAKVARIFNSTKLGEIAAVEVIEGTLCVDDTVAVYREGRLLVACAPVRTLRRFGKHRGRVGPGLECGVTLEWVTLQVGDVLRIG